MSTCNKAKTHHKTAHLRDSTPGAEVCINVSGEGCGLEHPVTLRLRQESTQNPLHSHVKVVRNNLDYFRQELGNYAQVEDFSDLDSHTSMETVNNSPASRPMSPLIEEPMDVIWTIDDEGSFKRRRLDPAEIFFQQISFIELCMVKREIERLIQQFPFCRRKLLAMLELIGIEPNPGPPKGSKAMVVYQPKKNKKKKNSQPQRNRVDAAVPGRYPTPSKVSLGIPHMAAYMRCLNDPFSEPPVRAGAGCAIPTGLFSCYIRLPVTLGSGGMLASYCWIPSRLQQPLMASGTATSPYAFGYAGPIAFPQFNAINALYEKCRLLAAGIRIIPMQNSTADQGQITTALIPSVRVADLGPFGVTASGSASYGYNEYPNFPQALSIPFKVGASLFWRPQDVNSFVFREAPLTDTQSASQSSSFLNETLQGIPFGVIGISGLASAASYVIEMISHFEGTIAAGNAGVIDLQRAPPTSESQMIAIADRVFGETNRTGKPGYYGSFNPKVSSSGPKSGSSNWSSNLLQLGSSVAPLLLSLL